MLSAGAAGALWSSCKLKANYVGQLRFNRQLESAIKRRRLGKGAGADFSRWPILIEKRGQLTRLEFELELQCEDASITALAGQQQRDLEFEFLQGSLERRYLHCQLETGKRANKLIYLLADAPGGFVRKSNLNLRAKLKLEV